MGGGRAAAEEVVKEARERFAWIDVAKGIGILAVVIGHVWTRGPVRDLMYSFHMPLFFLLSGYLFSPRPAGVFARRQLRAQGITYAAFLLLLVMLDLIVEPARGHRPIFTDWPGDIGRIMLGGSELRGPFTAFWFVPCLLLARLIFNAIGGRFHDLLGGHWLLIAAVSLVVAHWIGGLTDYSPLGLLSVPMALFLLWAGAVSRRVVATRVTPWLLPLVLAALFWFPPINIKAGDYGWPLLSIAGAIATSLLIFRAAHWQIIPGTPLRALGHASLVIMYLHAPVVHYLAPYLGKPLLLMLGVVLPLGAYQLFGRWKLTRRVFLAQD